MKPPKAIIGWYIDFHDVFAACLQCAADNECRTKRPVWEGSRAVWCIYCKHKVSQRYRQLIESLEAAKVRDIKKYGSFEEQLAAGIMVWG